MVPW